VEKEKKVLLSLASKGNKRGEKYNTSRSHKGRDVANQLAAYTKRGDQKPFHIRRGKGENNQVGLIGTKQQKEERLYRYPKRGGPDQQGIKGAWGGGKEDLERINVIRGQ